MGASTGWLPWDRWWPSATTCCTCAGVDRCGHPRPTTWPTCCAGSPPRPAWQCLTAGATMVELDLDPERPGRTGGGARAAGDVATPGSSWAWCRTTSSPAQAPVRRVWLCGDATRSLGAVAEPECARIIAAIDLAEELGVPLEWVAVSSGARISMESGHREHGLVRGGGPPSRRVHTGRRRGGHRRRRHQRRRPELLERRGDHADALRRDAGHGRGHGDGSHRPPGPGPGGWGERAQRPRPGRHRRDGAQRAGAPPGRRPGRGACAWCWSTTASAPTAPSTPAAGGPAPTLQSATCATTPTWAPTRPRRAAAG